MREIVRKRTRGREGVRTGGVWVRERPFSPVVREVVVEDLKREGETELREPLENPRAHTSKEER